MRTYSDATLEHYADRFIALRLARHGVNLEQYLANPARFERLALEPEPPLPAQQAAALRLWWAWDTGLAPAGASTVPTALPANYQCWRELIAQWRHAEATVERDIAHLPRRNGAFIEPLHHHRFPRGGQSDFTKRGA
ncbi:hypothetical protein [Halomonas sp. JS92-SW72]|uniref:hypothetical protein n=1 Tax=Halomonas sp. JS92-SW72 TaxID=2306583 RepID=UPI000E5A9A74|nr:hypothetical protein [Halomonas sp. JS92-SW72]AXY41623.1 hypothetical protein D1793_05110 [Halomonas sp. JS92-SW72]